MATPQSPKMVQYMLLFSFAMLPILLLVFVASNFREEPSGSTLVPILVSGVAIAAAIYWLLNRMDADQTPATFQTNMLVALAFGELSSLMGIFLGVPAGLSPYPFVGANLLVIFFALMKLNGYWSTRSG